MAHTPRLATKGQPAARVPLVSAAAGSASPQAEPQDVASDSPAGDAVSTSTALVDSDVESGSSDDDSAGAGLTPPPFLMFTAGMEVPGLRQQAERFQASLQASGVVAELHSVPRCFHLSIVSRINHKATVAHPVILTSKRFLTPLLGDADAGAGAGVSAGVSAGAGAGAGVGVVDDGSSTVVAEPAEAAAADSVVTAEQVHLEETAHR